MKIVDYRLFGTLLCLLVNAVSSFPADQNKGPDPTTPWIKTTQPLTLLSANDGQAHIKLDPSSMISNNPVRFAKTNLTRDSITVVHLGPNHPPIVKTIYDTVPNTIFGPPYLATSRDGRYGFVTCHTDGMFTPKSGNLLTVIDLSSPELTVVQKVRIPFPTMAIMHPDGKHLIVGCATGFQVFELLNGQLVLQKDNKLNMVPDSMDISPKGDRVLAVLSKAPSTHEFGGVHAFSYRDGVIEYQHEVIIRNGLPKFDQPFSIRFSPDGKRALALNGGGNNSKGSLDDVLSIDMTMDPPEVTEFIPQVADGIESVAFHPKGNFAVLSCLEDFPTDAQMSYSHLAVVDLTRKPLRLLYEINIEAIPEGIAFTPDGSQLFVQLTSANHIAVFDVEGFMLNRSPFVIRVGHGPSSMGLALRFMK
jgi:DNA-binding beta-propeller fold protein YncE